jgi:myosin heavy subunit
LRAATAALNERDATIRTLQARLVEASNLQSSTEGELELARLKIDQVTSEASFQGGQYESMNRELETTKAGRAEVERQLFSTTGQANMLRRQIEKLQQSLKEEKERNVALKREHEQEATRWTLTKIYDQQVVETQKTQEELRQARAAIDALRQENKMLNENLLKMRHETLFANSKEQIAQKRIASEKQRMTAVEEENELLKHKLKELGTAKMSAVETAPAKSVENVMAGLGQELIPVDGKAFDIVPPHVKEPQEWLPEAEHPQGAQSEREEVQAAYQAPILAETVPEVVPAETVQPETTPSNLSHAVAAAAPTGDTATSGGSSLPEANHSNSQRNSFALPPSTPGSWNSGANESCERQVISHSAENDSATSSRRSDSSSRAQTPTATAAAYQISLAASAGMTDSTAHEHERDLAADRKLIDSSSMEIPRSMASEEMNLGEAGSPPASNSTRAHRRRSGVVGGYRPGVKRGQVQPDLPENPADLY